MDRNRIEGTKHDMKGAHKEMAGKPGSHPARQPESQAEKNVGKVQKEPVKAVDPLNREHKH